MFVCKMSCCFVMDSSPIACEASHSGRQPTQNCRDSDRKANICKEERRFGVISFVISKGHLYNAPPFRG